jgi:hypothetical protein
LKIIPFLNRSRKNLRSEKYVLRIRDPEKPILDPGYRGQKGPGSGSATNLFWPQMWIELYNYNGSATNLFWPQMWIELYNYKHMVFVVLDGINNRCS